MTYDRRQVAHLASEIVRHRSLYYRGSPEISDADYDELEEQLRALVPDHPALQMVGADSEGAGGKVEHVRPMLSLAKTYDLSELHGWAKDEVVMGTLKIDGNSISLVYENGRLAQAKTRGNGRLGEDVKAKVAWISDCTPQITELKTTEVRGELYCGEEQFLKLVEEMIALGLERPSNPRNIVAGILGRKQHIELARYFSFASFDVLGGAGEDFLDSEQAKFVWLQEQGFPVPLHKLVAGPEEITAFLDVAKEYMVDGDFAIDGAVFTYNRTELHRQLGETAHHPRFKMSFKWKGETAVARIRDFTWSTSRLGIVTPVAVIEPVYLSGASITNVTLHNAEHVRLFDLKCGDEIEIVRSGEVIPKFLRVISVGPGTYLWPTECASCKGNLQFDGVRLYCPNRQSCPAQQIGAILNWIRNAEIDDLSEKRLIALLEIGLVKHMSDLYRLTVEDLLKMPLTKDKMAQKLYQNIQKSRNLPLAKFLNGLGIQGMGLTTWEALLEHFPSLERIKQVTVAELVKVEGFAEKSATQMVEGLRLKAEDIERLFAVGVIPAAALAKANRARSEITGKTLVITGTMSMPRNEIEEMIKARGGKLAGAVSKNTYALVIDDLNSTSSKAKKARELGVPMWSEGELLACLGADI